MGWCDVVRHGSIDDCSSFEHSDDLAGCNDGMQYDCDRLGSTGMLELIMQALCRAPYRTAECARE